MRAASPAGAGAAGTGNGFSAGPSAGTPGAKALRLKGKGLPVRSIEDIKARNYNLDIRWLKDEEESGDGDLPEPEELLATTKLEMETALAAIGRLEQLLAGRNGKGEEADSAKTGGRQ